MGYALFAQKKLVLCGMINLVQMNQVQRSDEQIKLSTNTLTLQSRVSSLQSAQYNALTPLYDKLSKSYENSTDIETDATSLTDAEFEEKYNFKKADRTQYVRKSIDAQINAKQKEYETEINKINAQIQLTSIKENAIEMEVKRLDTKLTALQQQLEKIEEAEGKSIEKSTPKFNGLG